MKNKNVFVDTSYLLALQLKNDQNHEIAKNHWQDFVKDSFSLVTTSYIFDETVTYLNSRGFHEKASEVGENLLLSPAVELIQVDETLFFEGWIMFQKQTDKRYSLTDCISFIVMKQKEMQIALTFDKHFVQAGFSIKP